MNLYEILKIGKDAVQSEIKKAYLALSKVHHPDKGGDPEEFKAISDAYSVLKDPEKKKRYDETGEIPGADKEGFVYSELNRLFVEIVNMLGDNVIYTDIFSKMLEVVTDNISKVNNQKRQIENKVKTFQDIKSRIKGEFYISLADNQIEGFNNQINQLNENIELLGKMKEFIEKGDFSFRTEERPEQQYTSQWGFMQPGMHGVYTTRYENINDWEEE